MVLRSIYVSCDGQSFYLQDRGGVRDEVRWYGPIGMAALSKVTLVAQGSTAPAR